MRGASVRFPFGQKVLRKLDRFRVSDIGGLCAAVCPSACRVLLVRVGSARELRSSCTERHFPGFHANRRLPNYLTRLRLCAYTLRKSAGAST
jgi:hypothetical protein